MTYIFFTLMAGVFIGCCFLIKRYVYPAYLIQELCRHGYYAECNRQIDKLFENEK